MRPQGGRAFARNEGMGESSVNEENKTDCQSDQKFNHKIPSGYDMKIGPHTGSDVVQVTEDYHPPDPNYWEEIMPQFDLDDAAIEADLIVEEVSCNMIEPESENDVSQYDDRSCTEDCAAQLCASTLSSTSLHTAQLEPDEISGTLMITCVLDGAAGFPNPEDTFFFNDKMIHDEAPITLLTSEGTQLLDKCMINSVYARECLPTGKVLRLHEPSVVTEPVSGDPECMLNVPSDSDCLGLHISNNPLQKIPRGQPEIWCLFGTQIVKTLHDTGAYRSLIKLTVLDGVQKDVILERNDEVHTLHCANKMTNETMGSVKLRFVISDEVYEHWFLIFKEKSCPVILGLDFLKENRMCI